jgi:hypothetical protein
MVMDGKENMRFVSQFKTLAQQETPAERRKRMLPGAMYGLVIAASYGLVGSFVNQLSFPDLPVGVNWEYLLIALLFFAVWLGIGGAFVNWFTQTEESLVISLSVMSAIALAASWLTFEGPLPAQLGKIFLLVLPVLAISLLMTLTLRWLGVQHADALEKGQVSLRKRILSLIMIAILIGGGTGFALTRWTTSTQRAVRYSHEKIQMVIANPSDSESLFLMRDVPEIKAHLNTPYTLRGKPSGQSVVAVEVNIDFKDGYRIACMLLVFPDQNPFPQSCTEGEDVSLTPNE